MKTANYLFRKIKSKFKKYGINILRENSFMIIDTRRMKPSPEMKELRYCIYYLLNTYEKHFFILIKGLPYCLFPEAHDHIIYSGTKNVSYSKTPQCRSCKYGTACPGIEKSKEKFFRETTPIPDIPSNITIELTKTCNLKCEFCMNNRSPLKTSPSFNKIKKILDTAKKLNIKYIRFTGGEPLLRKDILKILSYAKSKDFYIFFNTNATLATRPLIKKLEKYIDNILISLCGYNFHTEGVINKRKSSFKDKLANILRFKNSKIPHIRIGTVISKLLIKDFAEYSSLIRKIGIKNWEFYRPMKPLSRDYKDSKYDITKDDFLKLLKYLYTLRETGINAYIANALPFCITEKNSFRPIIKGAQDDDGHSRLVFDSRGFFKPSYFIDKNIGTDIRQAWKHPFIKKLRSFEYLPGRCIKCVYFRWCLGGSRYLAKEHLGNYFKTDPLINPSALKTKSLRKG